jgi:hypothetical protein
MAAQMHQACLTAEQKCEQKPLPDEIFADRQRAQGPPTRAELVNELFGDR